MREECERPSTTRSTGEEGGSVSSAAHDFTSAAAGPTEEGAPQGEAREYRARYSPSGSRQASSRWSTLAALSEATEADHDDPDFWAKLSAGSGIGGYSSEEAWSCEIVPTSADGLSAVLGDLAELSLDDLIAEYDALKYTSGGRHA